MPLTAYRTGLPATPQPVTGWPGEMALIRDLVQIAVRNALLNFFSAETASGHSVWIMSIDPSDRCLFGSKPGAPEVGPNICFHRAEGPEDVCLLLRTALELTEQHAEPGGMAHFACLQALTQALHTGEKIREALDAVRNALGWVEAHTPENHPGRALYLAHRARLLRQAAAADVLACAGDGPCEEEERDLLEVMRIIRAQSEVDWATAHQALSQLADLYLKREEFAKAELLLRRLEKAAAAILDDGHLQTAAIRFHLGVLFRSTSRLQEAQTMLRRALRTLGEHHRSSGQEPLLLGRAKEHYAHALIDAGTEPRAAIVAANDVREGSDEATASKKPGLLANSPRNTAPLSFTATCPGYPAGLPKGQPFHLELAIHPPAEHAAHADTPPGERAAHADTTPGERADNVPSSLEPGVTLVLLLKPDHVLFSHEDVLRRPYMIEWKGVRTTLHIGLRCPDSVPDRACRETIDVFAEGVRIGALELDLHFAETGNPCASVQCRFAAVSSAYCCYAPEDRYEAMGRLERLEALVPGLKVVRNAETLRALKDSRTLLRETIAQSSRFFLFWSSHAKQSEDVGWEWRYALEAHGIGWIDVVRIEANAGPPKELKLAFERSLGARVRPAGSGRIPGGARPSHPVFGVAWPDAFIRRLPKGELFSFEISVEDFGCVSVPADEANLPTEPASVDIGMVFEPASLVFPDRKPRKVSRLQWTGPKCSFQFDVLCPREVAEQTCPETVRVYANGVPVGTMLLKFHFGGESIGRKPLEFQFEPFHSAVACFAVEDRYEVQGRLDGVAKVTPDYRVIPCPAGSGLRMPGKEIEETERFVLFWSSRAKSMHPVREQWGHALNRKQIGALDLVRLDAGVPSEPELEPAFDRALPLREEAALVPLVSCSAHPEKLPREQPFRLDLGLELPCTGLPGLFAGGGPAEAEPVIELAFRPGQVRFTDGSLVKVERWFGGSRPVTPWELVCPPHSTGRMLQEKIVVFVENIRAGEILLDLHFDDRGRYGLAAECRFQPAPAAHWCFAPTDTYEVIDRLEKSAHLLPGHDLEKARQAKRLRTNPAWVKHEIESHERFVLFWSTRTEKAADVMAELMHAVQSRGRGAIDLVLLEPISRRPHPDLEDAWRRSLGFLARTAAQRKSRTSDGKRGFVGGEPARDRSRTWWPPHLGRRPREEAPTRLPSDGAASFH